MQRIFHQWDLAQAYINIKLVETLNIVSNYNQNITVSHKTLFLFILCIILILALIKYLPQKQHKIYIRDFQIFTSGDKTTEFSNTQMLQLAREKYNFRADQLNFMRRISNNNGLGQRCCIPPNMAQCKYTIDDARCEAEYVMFPVVQKLLEKANLKATDIDVLVTNCSLFCPTPSLSAMIINHFKMKETIHNFSLGGMGCSASPCGTDLVQHFLQQKKYKYALHVSTENITQNFYKGKNRSMLLPNALFRVGCAVVLYTNIKDKNNKYEVQHVVRTHIGANDEAYNCVYQTIDDEKKVGVYLARSITANAIKCLTINMRQLFVAMLPLSLKLDYLIRVIVQKIYYMYQTKITKLNTTYPKPLLPKIEKYVTNFCFHTGGRAVIDGMQNLFSLNEKQIEASRGALLRYGNISSASIWYELAYHESSFCIKKGNIIWQIAFGSGFKTNSLVLKSLSTYNKVNEHRITWFDEQNKNYRYANDQLSQAAIDPDEMQKCYEDYDRVRDEQDEEKEWLRAKEKYSSRFLKEVGSNCNDIKQVQQIK